MQSSAAPSRRDCTVRRTRPGPHTRKQILDPSLRLFSERGFTRATLRGIATAADPLEDMLLFSDQVPPGYKKAFAGLGDFQVGPVARPDGIRFTDIPPETRSGRIGPHLLREITSGTSARGDTMTPDDASVLEKVRTAWRAPSGQPRQARARRPLVRYLGVRHMGVCERPFSARGP